MAQNVTIAGATYNDVPSIVVPKSSSGDAIFVDPTPTTATAEDVVSGKQFLSANGTLTTGSAVIPEPATATPLMDGTAAVGSSTKYARENHRHPSDTTKYTINGYGTGTTDVSIRPLIAFARANRLAFLPAEQIIIEKTTDGGVTWVDANYSDGQKKALFSTRGASLLIPLLNGAKSTQCGLRVTFSAMKYNVPSGTAETEKYNYWSKDYVNKQERYSNIRELWFWLSANNDAIRCQVFRATGNTPNTWATEFNTDFALKGWSGSDWIRCGGATFGGGTNQPQNYWNWRIVFWSRMNDGATEFSSATAQAINGIAGYGDSVWGSSNGMMKEDHLYTWDTDQNATFPANVTATSFVGNLTGNVTGNATTATKSTQDESGNNIKASYASSMSISGNSLSLNNKNGTALSTVTIPTELPTVTSSDNGKFLGVSNGSWDVMDNNLSALSSSTPTSSQAGFMWFEIIT